MGLPFTGCMAHHMKRAESGCATCCYIAELEAKLEAACCAGCGVVLPSRAIAAEHVAGCAEHPVGKRVLAAERALSEAREALEKADRWVLYEAEEKGRRYRLEPFAPHPKGVLWDHACNECLPSGPLVSATFQCAVHAAKARQRAALRGDDAGTAPALQATDARFLVTCALDREPHERGSHADGQRDCAAPAAAGKEKDHG